MLAAIGKRTVTDDVSHRFLSYCTDLLYSEHTTELASDYIVLQVMQAMQVKQTISIQKFILDNLTEPGMGGALGQMFEQLVHRRMLAGIGDVDVEDIADEKQKRTLHLPSGPMKLCVLPSHETVTQHLGVGAYGKPLKKTFPSVDAIIRPNILLQVTVGDKHPIKGEPLKKIITQLDGFSESSEYLFIFVVPQADSVKLKGKQHFHTTKSTKMVKLPAELKKVTQLVYRMPLSEWKSL